MSDDQVAHAPDVLVKKFAEWIPEGARVLDIGGSHNVDLKALAKSGHEVTTLAARNDSTRAGLTKVSADFIGYEPPRVFDVILCFDLMQTLKYQECASLVSRLHQWLKPGGTLFITTLHLEDSEFEKYVTNWERRGIRSFRSPDEKEHRLFLEKGELLQLFFRWQAVHHWEGMDDGSGVIEAVLTCP
ncbi:MAG: 2-polyprenyl-3-methyl-5-hydroxy-6-metoxy-1,4-benzoquinol methylase [Candidatus Krumholzibacteriia bacterium]|jgi:2-polyprenyl-3-methyl-5-hydroxy-6-metoxy-1,4-benzoquinol methylase